MRVIDPDILDEMQKNQVRSFVLMTLLDTYYYTDCDVPIVFEGNTFNPIPFKVNNIRQSSNNLVDSFDLTIDNIGQEMMAAFVGGNPQGGNFTLKVVFLDSNYAIVADDSVSLFEGIIDDWSLDEDKIDIVVVNLFIAWSQKTLSRHPASCRWKIFKGTECKYSGDEVWCDRSYARCNALDNVVNFGGFPHILELESKEIWWGNVPK